MRDRSSMRTTTPGLRIAGRGALVVEPDAGVREQVSGWLAADGYRVHAVGTFDGAQRVLESTSPRLLLVEVRLGSFNGLQLAIRCRHECPSMGAIVTSTVADPVLAAEASRHGAVWLVKPLTRSAVGEAIAALLHQAEQRAVDG